MVKTVKTIFSDFVYASRFLVVGGSSPHFYENFIKLQAPPVQIGGLEMKRLALPPVLGSMLVVLTCQWKATPTASQNDDLLRISVRVALVPAFAQVSPIRRAAVVLLPCLGMHRGQQIIFSLSAFSMFRNHPKPPCKRVEVVVSEGVSLRSANCRARIKMCSK